MYNTPTKRPEFDPLTAPLHGISLIEASAGTGKTYTITSLYVRLLLEKGYLPEQILVVTFTEAAARELKERIRARLTDFHDLLLHSSGAGNDPFLVDLAARQPDREKALAAVVNGLRSNDAAAVCTIHGFCRRILEECAFESGALFETEFLEDDIDLLRRIVDDYWRSASPAWDQPLHGYLFHLNCNADSLFEQLRPVIHHVLFNGRDSLVAGAEPGTAGRPGDALGRMAAVWAEEQRTIRELLLAGSLSKDQRKGNYRPENIEAWREAIDRFLTGAEPENFPFESFAKLSAATLRENTLKNKETPDHPFFDLAETLVHDLDLAHRQLRLDLVDHCVATLPVRKETARVMTYDDLLIRMREALRDDGNGPELARKIRNRFPVALIDEFQDTDPVQYDIFATIYHHPDKGDAVPCDRLPNLFMIGDPKQAIYSFRGADIFAYLQAAAAAPHQFTLRTNYRSEPLLIEAVNRLFENGGSHPFLLPGLRFEAAAAADHDPAILTTSRDGGDRPLTFWLFPEMESVKMAKLRLAAAVAGEIARLLRQGAAGEARIGDLPLRAGDIAVLVRSHADGEIIRRELAARAIRAVGFSTASIFATTEARELALLLDGVLHPWDGRKLRAALATALLGWDGAALGRLGEDERLWEEVLEKFLAWQDLWNRRGLAVMLQVAAENEAILPRLAGLLQGERRVTNLRHLMELMQEAAHEHGLGPSELLAWLRAGRAGERPAGDEEQLRLESDENLVKIVTIHKSKGLQYPVVFCPFLWQGKGNGRNRNPVVLFHDHDRPRLDLDSPELELHRQQQWAENLAEELRLLYVAATRARNRCYLAWGRVMSGTACVSAWSALGYLLHPVDPEAPDLEERLRLRFDTMGEAEIVAPLRWLADDLAIAVNPLPEAMAGQAPGTPAETPPPGTIRPWSRHLTPATLIRSFSSLRHQEGAEGELPDHDAGPAAVISGPAALAGPRPPEHSPAGPDAGGAIFDFPRGVRAGSCLHAIMEELDFSQPDPVRLAGLARDKLRLFGIDTAWTDTVAAWIDDILATPLDPRIPGLRLAGLSRRDRLDEMEFYYAMPALESGGLRHLFSGRPEDSESKPGEGMHFMKGFMDLIFRFQGRYYIVDYKSNFLGPAVDDYRPESLALAMREAGYDQQYRIYVVALHRYLGRRLPDYDYDRHMGGVYYLFLRGMRPEYGDTRGIFRDLPDRRLVEDLDRRLTAGKQP